MCVARRDGNTFRPRNPDRLQWRTAMSQWKNILTFTVAAAMVATTAFAQSAADKPSTSKDSPTSGMPSATPGGSPSDATKSDTTKSDTMKSDTMKSDTMKSSKAMASGGAGRDRVKAAQQALKDKGHDPGPIDGVMGPKTHAALKDFQKKEGLKDSGRLDQETIVKLGIEAG